MEKPAHETMNDASDSQIIQEFRQVQPGINENIKRHQQEAEEEGRKIDEEFACIHRNFHDISEAARKYLREQLKKPWYELESQKRFLEERLNKLEIKVRQENAQIANLTSAQLQERREQGHLSGNKMEIHNLQQDIDKQNKSVDAKGVNKQIYKASKHAQKFYDEILKLFYKYIKHMYRKFKGLIEDSNSVCDMDRQREMTTQLKEMEESREDLNKLATSMNDEKNKMLLQEKQLQNNSLMGPEALKRLDKFPDLTDGNYMAALKKYGQFNLPKKPTHESFEDLKAYPPLVQEDGTVYEGQWKTNKRVGCGKAQFSSGSYYDGYWVDDKPSLLGRIIDRSGDVYEGFIDKGKAHGKGIFIKMSNYRYVGYWHDDQKHGFGEEFMENGTIYKGDFFLGRHQGFGSLTMSDGAQYEGNFFDNKFSGKGKFVWINGEKFEGDWAEDRKHGKGTYTYEDGQEYTGDFVDDTPHGFGELKKLDGTSYKGFWNMGAPVGIGLGVKQETKQVGQWINGQFNSWANMEESMFNDTEESPMKIPLSEELKEI